MKQPLMKIDVAQDGQVISNKLIKRYDLRRNDLFFPNSNTVQVNFVGVIQRGTHILVSIPKHFKNIDEFKTLSDVAKVKYIRLIMDSINESVRGFQNSDYNLSENLSSDFALNAYFNVYKYFSQYGLYHEKHETVSSGNGNKISWKDTLHKASKFISNGNIIFSPLFYKKKQNDETIVTESMIFVINYTQQILGELMHLPSNSKIAERGVNMSILRNLSVIAKLQEVLNKTFKDIDQALIRNIIIFLKKANSIKRQIPDIKYYNYENIWEKAVSKYLNERFVKVDKNGNVIFSKDNKLNLNNTFIKRSFKYNTVKKHSNWRLEPDHYFKDDKHKTLYIFDSKYYRSLNDLNHKQFVYHVLLSNKYPAYKIFDSLVMPYEKDSKTEDYLNVKSDYLTNDKSPIIIHLTRLNMIDVLNNYTRQIVK